MDSVHSWRLANCFDGLDRDLKSQVEVIVSDGEESFIQLGIDSRSVHPAGVQGGITWGDRTAAGLMSAHGSYVAFLSRDDALDIERTLSVIATASENGYPDLILARHTRAEPRSGAEVFPTESSATSRSSIVEQFSFADLRDSFWEECFMGDLFFSRDWLQRAGLRPELSSAIANDRWAKRLFVFEACGVANTALYIPYSLAHRIDHDSEEGVDTNTCAQAFQKLGTVLPKVLANNQARESSIETLYKLVLLFVDLLLHENGNINRLQKLAHRVVLLLDQSIIRVLDPKMQVIYYTWNSPLYEYEIEPSTRILLYNYVPFDNPWDVGGGVTVYCRNLVEAILEMEPTAEVCFLSSGFAYDSTRSDTYVRRLSKTSSSKLQQFEIVNSPVPADQRNIYMNPGIAVENPAIQSVLRDFILGFGGFSVVHFNNVEGLSLDIFDLRRELPDTRFIYSAHNYMTVCATGYYYMRHKHRICTPEHTAADCRSCLDADIDRQIGSKTWERGLFNNDRAKCMSQSRWLRDLGLNRLDEEASPTDVIEFARTAVEKINENCDSILAVSKRVAEIIAAEGIDQQKTIVSYIGSPVAEGQVQRSLADRHDGLRLVFLGGDINFEEKGYPWLLDALYSFPPEYARKIDLVMTTKNVEHSEIFSMCSNFRSVSVRVSYQHSDLGAILYGCNLGIVPVLWEDNLPQIALEMVAHGVPVLCSSAGGASELSDSGLFRFRVGDTRDFQDKVIHFMDHPDDLDLYWDSHRGLTTMHSHWLDLREVYGVKMGQGEGNIELSYSDHARLLLESQHLASVKATKIPPEEMQQVVPRMDQNAPGETGSLYGKRIFTCPPPPPGEAMRALLFSVELEPFDYSDVSAIIQFMWLRNVGPFSDDTFRVAATWMSESGSFELKVHQAEWEREGADLESCISLEIHDSTMLFYGAYNGQYSGYAWKALMLESRAATQSVGIRAENRVFITEADLLPLGASIQQELEDEL